VNSTDRKLEMNRPISRRDVINGIATLSAGAGAGALAATSTAPWHEITDATVQYDEAPPEWPVSLNENQKVNQRRPQCPITFET
jgi:hypothetical protein